MQVSGLPVQLAQVRIGRIDHQTLAAFGGRALGTGLLMRPVAELLRAPSPLAMLFGPCTGHDWTVLRTAAVGYSAACGSERVVRQRARSHEHVEPRDRVEADAIVVARSRAGWRNSGSRLRRVPRPEGSSSSDSTANGHAKSCARALIAKKQESPPALLGPPRLPLPPLPYTPAENAATAHVLNPSACPS